MTTPRIEETINKIVEAGKQRADWFEPSAEVILATTAKSQMLKAHQAGIVDREKRDKEMFKKGFDDGYSEGRDEAVERVREIRNQIPYGYKMTETCADEKVGAYIQALDNTLKALQNNK